MTWPSRTGGAVCAGPGGPGRSWLSAAAGRHDWAGAAAEYPVQFSVGDSDRSLNRPSTAFRIFVVIPIALSMGASADLGSPVPACVRLPTARGSLLHAVQRIN
jgi:hypothetical protein